jgi:ribonuclease HI
MPDSERLPRHPRVRIYTDGSCLPNPGAGGFAALLLYEHKTGLVEREVVGSDPCATNNQMELMGAIAGLEALKWRCAVTLYTDSQYVKNGITLWIRGWVKRQWRTRDNRPVKNRELWERLLAVSGRHEVDWRWVRGHSGNPHNERVDRLAVAARVSVGGRVG